MKLFVLTLLTKERKKYVFKNKETFPELSIVKSVNGYNKDEVHDELKKLDIKYIRLNEYTHHDGYIESFKTYGTLANHITKLRQLQYQVKNKIPFMCFIEDDLLLKRNFIQFIDSYKYMFLKYPTLNIIRLGDWGEGYITTYESAKRILQLTKKYGIIQNIDNQFRENAGKEYRVYNTPWQLMEKSNEGDCLKTDFLSKEFYKIFLNDENIIKKELAKIPTLLSQRLKGISPYHSVRSKVKKEEKEKQQAIKSVAKEIFNLKEKIRNLESIVKKNNWDISKYM